MGDRQRLLRTEEMATSSTAVTTVPAPLQEPEPQPVAVITLRPARSEPRRRVVWTEDTVDNEHMNKKKSKCCCIYEKPHRFGESDSEDSDDECEHCFGHVERRKHKKQQRKRSTNDGPEGTSTSDSNSQPSTSAQDTTTPS